MASISGGLPSNPTKTTGLDDALGKAEAAGPEVAGALFSEGLPPHPANETAKAIEASERRM
jgi:hypothetical protein